MVAANIRSHWKSWVENVLGNDGCIQQGWWIVLGNPSGEPGL